MLAPTGILILLPQRRITKQPWSWVSVRGTKPAAWTCRSRLLGEGQLP